MFNLINQKQFYKEINSRSSFITLALKMIFSIWRFLRKLLYVQKLFVIFSDKSTTSSDSSLDSSDESGHEESIKDYKGLQL